MPGGVPPDRGAYRGVNGEAQCRPACDVERKMGADIDTAQSHQGDGGQGEGAAAGPRRGRAATPRTTATPACPDRYPRPLASRPRRRMPGSRVTGRGRRTIRLTALASAQVPVPPIRRRAASSPSPASRPPRRGDGTERAQLHDGPGGQVDRIGQAVDCAECPDFPWAHAVVAHGTGGGQQGSQAEAKLDAGSGQHGGKGTFMLARGPHHGLSVGRPGRPDGRPRPFRYRFPLCPQRG